MKNPLKTPVLAQANPQAGSDVGFTRGLMHPTIGLNHICAKIAVGLWAAQRGGRARWLVPLTFVLVVTLLEIVGMAKFSK